MRCIFATPGANQCGPNSAACKIPIGGGEVLSLGQVSDPFVGSLEMTVSISSYRNGSVCPFDKSKTISTRIQFICDPHEDMGFPLIVDPEVMKWLERSVFISSSGKLPFSVILSHPILSQMSLVSSMTLALV